MEQLPREFERCRRYAYPLSVLMCDLDHFKQINDQRGHAAGDDVLQQFVARAQKSIRTNSDWMARYGGEEFLIVLPETPYEGAVVVAEKIRNLTQRTTASASCTLLAMCAANDDASSAVAAAAVSRASLPSVWMRTMAATQITMTSATAATGIQITDRAGRICTQSLSPLFSLPAFRIRHSGASSLPDQVTAIEIHMTNAAIVRIR